MRIYEVNHEIGKVKIQLSGLELEAIVSAMKEHYNESNLFTSELYKHLKITCDIVRHGVIKNDGKD